MTLAKGDFVELEYTGTLAEDGSVFDTTDEALAKKSSIYNNNGHYGNLVVVLGEHHLLAGVEKGLLGKEAGKNLSINVIADEGFGKKDPSLLQLVPTKKFFAQKINPMPGLRVTIDGMQGIVRSVSGGRTIVDFNHPLSGKDLRYSVHVKRVLSDVKEKIQQFLCLQLSQKSVDMHVSMEGSTAKVQMPFDLPKEISAALEGELKRLIKDVHAVQFSKREKVAAHMAKKA